MPNIAELTRQLRGEIQKQYGVDANIQISIHNHYVVNEHLDRAISNQIALSMSRIYGNVPIEHREDTGTQWVNIEPPHAEKTRLTIFYGEAD